MADLRSECPLWKNVMATPFEIWLYRWDSRLLSSVKCEVMPVKVPGYTSL
jgi:hypothetical protein